MDDDRAQQPEPPRQDDREALEEIRRLFARYRRIARHGMVTERDEPVEERETATIAGR
ncbi:MAG TPA: hypothetical protein VFX51_09625 [Solirubrobacteraceae bacterium]|nr:hypothetical protein [Solirubrobacteraceae bacterium]